MGPFTPAGFFGGGFHLGGEYHPGWRVGGLGGGRRRWGRSAVEQAPVPSAAVAAAALRLRAGTFVHVSLVYSLDLNGVQVSLLYSLEIKRGALDWGIRVLDIQSVLLRRYGAQSPRRCLFRWVVVCAFIGGERVVETVDELRRLLDCWGEWSPPPPRRCNGPPPSPCASAQRKGARVVSRFVPPMKPPPPPLPPPPLFHSRRSVAVDRGGCGR